MMQKLRKFMQVLLLMVLAVVAGLLCYSLPQHRVVTITGDEVRRVDRAGKFVDAGQAIQATRDVLFINTAEVDSAQVHVFRNEDTGFAYPWYFKFDAAEVQGRAQLLARQPDRHALVTYYGWRIAMLNMFPNAIDVQPWDSLDEPFPVFNTVFFVVLGVLLLVLWWKWRQFRRHPTDSA